jgi:3-dehydroquinate dehydratase-2
MNTILVLLGPNLNALGQRNTSVYGSQTLSDLKTLLTNHAKQLLVNLEWLQTNHEGVLIDALYEANVKGIRGILFNPGALTHYAYSLHDAIEAIKIPVIEVHLSNIEKREGWRSQSVIRPVVVNHFMGNGFSSFIDALNDMVERTR